MDAVLNWLWQGVVVAATLRLMLFSLERASANVRYVVCWTALLFVVALPALPLLQSTPALPDALRATQGEAIVSLPEAWWTSTRRDPWRVDALGRHPDRQVHFGDRRDPSRACSQPCVPIACGIRPALLASRPPRPPARHARPVRFGDDRCGARVGSADDRRGAVAADDARCEPNWIACWSTNGRMCNGVTISSTSCRSSCESSRDGIRRSGGSTVVCTSSVRSPATRSPSPSRARRRRTHGV